MSNNKTPQNISSYLRKENPQNLRILEYEITTEPIQNRYVKRLPDHIKDKIDDLYDNIAEIFNHKFDLKLLYPKRKKFHISEVANFMGIIGSYFFKTGEMELAEKYYKVLAEFAFDYPTTQKLRNELYPGFFRRIFRKISGTH